MKLQYWLFGAMVLGAVVRADDISLGEPGYGGSGCPQGSASTILSPDGKELTILFDSYVVEAVKANQIARKTCNLAVPIHVPNGFSASILQVDYRGYNALPRGADAVLTSEYFFAGTRGPRISETFRGTMDSDYLKSDRLLASAVVWSPCGAETNLRINSSMRVKTNSRGDDALSTVDSLDLSAGMVFHLQLRRCSR